LYGPHASPPCGVHDSHVPFPNILESCAVLKSVRLFGFGSCEIWPIVYMAATCKTTDEFEGVTKVTADFGARPVLVVEGALSGLTSQPNPNLRALSIDASHQSDLFILLRNVLLVDADLSPKSECQHAPKRIPDRDGLLTASIHIAMSSSESRICLNRGGQMVLRNTASNPMPQFLEWPCSPKRILKIHRDIHSSPVDIYRRCYIGVSPCVRQGFIDGLLVQQRYIQRASYRIRHDASMQC
jgi:hypothetical protein